MSSRSISISRYNEDYDDDFNELDDSTTRYTTTQKSVGSKNIKIDQSSFITNEISNVNKSFDSESSFSGKKSGLSSQELKTKLIETFKNKGILDSMKSQLRNKLALEFNSNFEQNKNKAFLNQKSNLALNTINCLIINHLKSTEYDYTLSVFMPECGIGLNEVYSLTDILHILKVSPESKLYNELSNSPVIKSKGLLWFLISYFCSHYVTHEIGTQTEFDASLNKASLDFKLQKLDSYYSSKLDDKKLKLDDKMTLYQNGIEEKIRQEYQDKIIQFKEIELARIRQEEKEKIRLEMENYRLNLDHTYQKRNEALNQKEQNLSDLIKQRKEIEERELYMQRQHLLDEMKQLKEREADFKRNAEMQIKFYQTDTSKYDKLDQDLKQRELKLKQDQETFDQRLRDERERIKLDLERAYAQREFVLQSVETKNKQDSTHNEIERAHLDRIKREYQDQLIKSNEMELELQKCLGQLECFKQENELMKQKLNYCMDYDFIKQENNMLKYKLDISKEIIGKKSLNGASSRRSVSEKQPAYVPQRKRSVTFADNNELLNSNIVPPLMLSKNNEDYSLMQATEMGADQLPKDNIKSIQDENELLETFRDVGDRLLSDEIEKSEIKENLEHHNLVNQELKDLYEMQVYEQRKLQETISDVKKHVEFLYHGVLPENTRDTTSYLIGNKNESVLNTSLEFIESAKERLKYLENEGDKIEQNYRDYQHNMKSKYYPVTDNDSNELKIKEKMNEYHKTIDVEKFLESTLKASLNAQLIREELEAEFKETSLKKDYKTSVINMSELRNVEEIIRTAPIIRDNSNNFNIDSIRKQVLNDQSELKEFQALSKHSNFMLKQDVLDSSIQSNSLSTVNVKQKSLNKEHSTELDDKTSKKSNSDFIISSPKVKSNNFGLGDYVKMFDEEKRDAITTNETKTAANLQKKSVKIEYSSSSSSSPISTASSSSDDDSSNNKNNIFKRKENDKKETAKNDDDDDDFNW